MRYIFPGSFLKIAYIYPNGAIRSAKETKGFLIWVLLVKREHILAFYRPNFIPDLKGTRGRTKRTGFFALFH